MYQFPEILDIGEVSKALHEAGVDKQQICCLLVSPGDKQYASTGADGTLAFITNAEHRKVKKVTDTISQHLITFKKGNYLLLIAGAYANLYVCE
jgi:WD40 repeat protein